MRLHVSNRVEGNGFPARCLLVGEMWSCFFLHLYFSGVELLLRTFLSRWFLFFIFRGRVGFRALSFVSVSTDVYGVLKKIL